MNRILTRANRVAAAAMLVLSGAVFAQNWPVKPVRIIVPFPPGATLDIMTRLVAQKAAESTGQPFVVENRAGANGQIGSEFVARSAPDGYTILATTTSTHISAPYLVKKLPYDPHKDVTPITAAVDAVTVLAVNPAVPVNNVKELVEYVRKYPGKVSYGSAGIGNAFHLIGEMFQSSQNVSLLHVPYKGIVQAVQETATGQVNMVFSAVNNVIPLMKSNKLKVLPFAYGMKVEKVYDNGAVFPAAVLDKSPAELVAAFLAGVFQIKRRLFQISG